MATLKRISMDQEAAETLALQGLTFLAGEPQRLARFLSLTGMSPQDLRSWATEPRLQTAVLEHLLTDESLLLVAASELSMAPEAFSQAQSVLLKALAR